MDHVLDLQDPPDRRSEQNIPDQLRKSARYSNKKRRTTDTNYNELYSGLQIDSGTVSHTLYNLWGSIFRVPKTRSATESHIVVYPILPALSQHPDH